MTALTVGELKAKLATIPDDLPVCIPSIGYEFDYKSAATVVQTWIEWTEDSDEPEPDEPVSKLCVVIE